MCLMGQRMMMMFGSGVNLMTGWNGFTFRRRFRLWIVRAGRIALADGWSLGWSVVLRWIVTGFLAGCGQSTEWRFRSNLELLWFCGECQKYPGNLASWFGKIFAGYLISWTLECASVFALHDLNFHWSKLTTATVYVYWHCATCPYRKTQNQKPCPFLTSSRVT